MSARVELIDVGGWKVTAFVPCKDSFEAMVRIGNKYPGAQVLDVLIVEAAHA